MEHISSDLLGEYRALAGLCETLTPAQWRLRTDFHGWTPWDEIAHLAFFDETGLQAATAPELFAAEKEALQKQLATGEEISAITRRRFGHLDGKALLGLWRQRHEGLVAALSRRDPKERLPWYGPDMSARSFATARLMETWAHGQDIRDALGRQRGASPGLRHIAHLGVTTYGWTFVNRKLAVPQPVPFVDLAAPDGSRWTWGEPSQQDYVRGPALDFALLVTQRRHRADTKLQWAGAGAEPWTLLAQCFAGDPADGPAPGVRGSRA
jgi:uncharacterized protein (TIGR03084 family)